MRGERKRVLFSLKTILFLAILVFLSVWQYQNTYIGQEDASQQRYDFYTEYIHQIAPLKKEEQESQIEMLLSEIEKELETGIAKEESEVSELLQRQNALLMVHEQRAYIEGYQEYLDKIQSDADYIQKGGMFGSADGYPAKNAAKTAADYAKAEAVADQICLVPVYGFESIVKGDRTGIFAAIFSLYLSIMLVRYQKRGLWDMLFASKKGRMHFFFGQIAILFLGSMISVLFLYGARLAAGILFFQETDSWYLPVQCSSLFKSCILSVSLWGMLGLILLFHMAAAFVSALLFWLLNILVRQEKIAILVCLCISVFESVLYKNISASSNRMLLRFLNLAALWNIQEMMCGYQNMAIGNTPVGQYEIYVVFMGGLTALCAGAGILLGSRRHPKGSVSLSERLMEMVGKAVSRLAGFLPPIFSEWRKLLFFEHGFLVLLLFGWFAYTSFGEKNTMYLYSDTGLKDSIYCRIEGMNIQDAAEWLDEKISVNNRDLAELAQAQADLNDKKISYEEWDAIYLKYKNASFYAAVYEEIQADLMRVQQLEEKTSRSIQVVSPFGVTEFAGKLNLLEEFHASKYQKRLLWCLYELIVLIFLFAGVFPYEKKTKMRPLMMAYPRGRRILNRRKCRMAVWTVTFLWLIGSIMQFRQITVSGGSFHGLLEPAPVVDVFAALPVWIPLGLALAGVCLLRLIALLCVCGVILGIGSRCKSAAQTAAIGVLLFLLPSGLEYVFSLRFFPLSVLDVIQNLWEAPNVMLIESVILIIMGSVGYCVAVNNNKG